MRTLLNHPLAAEVTEQAVQEMERLFGAPNAPGSQMTARAAAGSEPEDVVAASMAALAGELIRAVRSGG